MSLASYSSYLIYIDTALVNDGNLRRIMNMETRRESGVGVATE